MTRYAAIVSTGAYLPEIERSNATMRERFGEVIDKFENSSGIRTRFYAPDNWATSDLACEAGKKALQNAGLKPEDLDLIILGNRQPGLHHTGNICRRTTQTRGGKRRHL
jgi:3-oxoacyl-[acyl-carrier-protein] synthase III